MKFWKKNYSVCVECGVHFEPDRNPQAKWGSLCKPHRIEPMKTYLRKQRVMAWAEDNWEGLEKQYEEAIVKGKRSANNSA